MILPAPHHDLAAVVGGDCMRARKTVWGSAPRPPRGKEAKGQGPGSAFSGGSWQPGNRCRCSGRRARPRCDRRRGGPSERRPRSRRAKPANHSCRSSRPRRSPERRHNCRSSNPRPIPRHCRARRAGRKRSAAPTSQPRSSCRHSNRSSQTRALSPHPAPALSQHLKPRCEAAYHPTDAGTSRHARRRRTAGHPTEPTSDTARPTDQRCRPAWHRSPRRARSPCPHHRSINRNDRRRRARARVRSANPAAAAIPER